MYWKAITILQNEPTNSPLKFLVLKFGGFYTKISFIGNIGYVMSGSGLTYLFETVYASTAVSHMLGGKAIARAVRGNYLFDTTFTTIILSNISKTEVCFEECADEKITRLKILHKFKFMTRATPRTFFKRLPVC